MDSHTSTPRSSVYRRSVRREPPTAGSSRSGIDNYDMTLQKSLRLTESKSVQIRLDAFNVFNHAQFYGPSSVNGKINSATFGQVVSATAPRLVQIAIKLVF